MRAAWEAFRHTLAACGFAAMLAGILSAGLFLP